MATAARPSSGWTSIGGLIASSVGVAVLIGFTLSEHEAVTAGVAVALLYAGLVSRAPTLVLGAALLTLSYAPESLDGALGPLSRPELQKGLVLLGLLPMALVRGVRPWFALPVLAYVVTALLSYIDGHINPALTLAQSLSTFVTLTLGWLALAIRWDPDRDLWLLKSVTLIALVSVVFGVVLQAAGIHDVVSSPTSFDATRRLRGAAIAPQLAMLAMMGAAASYACHRLLRWRPARLLILVNVAILAGTVTRGAALALIIAAAWPILRYGLQRFRDRPDIAIFRLFGVVVVLAAIAAVTLPQFESRNAGGRYVAGQGTTADPTSGRSEAWSEFYSIGLETRWFGAGLGAGPVTRIKQEGFLAQHNEYLRMFLEAGFIGGALVLLSIFAAVTLAIRRAPPPYRGDLTGLALALAFFSVTDNTLTSPSMTVPFCLILALTSSLRRTT